MKLPINPDNVQVLLKKSQKELSEFIDLLREQIDMANKSNNRKTVEKLMIYENEVVEARVCKLYKIKDYKKYIQETRILEGLG